MKLLHEFDREYFIIEFRYIGLTYWHKCCDATFGSLETAMRHVNNVRESNREYRVKVIAEGIYMAQGSD